MWTFNVAVIFINIEEELRRGRGIKLLFSIMKKGSLEKRCRIIHLKNDNDTKSIRLLYVI